MKENIKKILFAGMPFGIIMGIFCGIAGKNVYLGIVSGLFLGIFFGFFIWLFVFIQSKQFRKKGLGTSIGKEMMMEGVANHFKGSESVGGWLCLYSDKVIFKSHKINVQIHEIIIPINLITEVRTSLTLGVVPNGLQIIIDNHKEKFVVYNRKVWVQKIKEAILLTSEGKL